MKKSQLARLLARKHSIGTGAAADRVDRAVSRIIRALKRGQETRLPGVGVLIPGNPWGFRQDSDEL
jgi:nucleoid DNA-binding protein